MSVLGNLRFRTVWMDSSSGGRREFKETKMSRIRDLIWRNSSRHFLFGSTKKASFTTFAAARKSASLVRWSQLSNDPDKLCN